MTHNNTLSPLRIEKPLSGQIFGQRIIYYPSIDSTNRAARELALKEKAHGWVILADEQTAGRGRLDRTWDSDAGKDILASIIVYPHLPPEETFRLTMMASVAVVQAIERICGITCGIKWPNDIFLNGKKLCGILSEGQIDDHMQFIVIGIGLNVNSSMNCRTDLTTPAVSLQDASGKQHNRNALIAAMLEDFNRLYQINDTDGSHVKHAWEEHAMMLGRKVTIHSDDVISGIARGILPDGRLIVREASGREHLIVCGDLSLRLEQ